jgi:hypothetical protein
VSPIAPRKTFAGRVKVWTIPENAFLEAGDDMA